MGSLIISRVDADGVGRWMEIEAPFTQELTLGESVSINGTCLTVVKRTETSFSVQVSPTTLALTTLGSLEPGQVLNLERSVTPTTRLGGHWVLGHVDTPGEIAALDSEGDSHHVTIVYPVEFQHWVLPQGSITLDGISLTIISREANRLRVTIIPHTWRHTTAYQWARGTRINMEFDVLGKYVEHLLAPYASHRQE